MRCSRIYFLSIGKGWRRGGEGLTPPHFRTTFPHHILSPTTIYLNKNIVILSYMDRTCHPSINVFKHIGLGLDGLGAHTYSQR